MKVKAYLGIGFATAKHKCVLELDNDLTEEEIDNEVQEWANNYIEISWEVVEE